MSLADIWRIKEHQHYYSFSLKSKIIMEREDRTPGYYWIRRFKNEDWIVAEWTGSVWIYKGYTKPENAIFEIDEKQIVREGK